jgi:hypothetical protein
MAILTIIEKTNNAGEPVKHGETLVIDSEKLIGVATKSLYVRKGFKNGTLFLSQKGNGANGAGDICKINEDAELEVNSKLFDRLTVYAEKANAIVK